MLCKLQVLIKDLKIFSTEEYNKYFQNVKPINYGDIRESSHFRWKTEKVRVAQVLGKTA